MTQNVYVVTEAGFILACHQPASLLPGFKCAVVMSGEGPIRGIALNPFEGYAASQISILHHQNCTEIPKPYGFTITESIMCAGGNGSGNCAKNPGGALLCTKGEGATTSSLGDNHLQKQQKHFLCGIVSWDGKDCVETELWRSPAFYTDVSKLTRWIGKFVRIWDKHYKKGRRKEYFKICSPFLGLTATFHIKAFAFKVTQMATSLDEQVDCGGAGKFRCPNSGLCIPDSSQCNGSNDCNPLEDWDERNCTRIICKRGEFQCQSRQFCIESDKILDQFPFDVRGEGDELTNLLAVREAQRCRSSNVCIPSSYFCDGDDDCLDGSDELGCLSV